MENKELNEEKVIEVNEEEKEIVVKRESFKGNDGKKYYSYFVDSDIEFTTEKGKKEKKQIKASLMPKDKGGYDLLETLFLINSRPNLIVKNETMVDTTGKRTKYSTYKVSVLIGDNPLVISLKPINDSDKSILGLITK